MQRRATCSRRMRRPWRTPRRAPSTPSERAIQRWPTRESPQQSCRLRERPWSERRLTRGRRRRSWLRRIERPVERGTQRRGQRRTRTQRGAAREGSRQWEGREVRGSRQWEAHICRSHSRPLPLPGPTRAGPGVARGCSGGPPRAHLRGGRTRGAFHRRSRPRSRRGRGGGPRRRRAPPRASASRLWSAPTCLVGLATCLLPHHPLLQLERQAAAHAATLAEKQATTRVSR